MKTTLLITTLFCLTQFGQAAMVNATEEGPPVAASSSPIGHASASGSGAAGTPDPLAYQPLWNDYVAEGVHTPS